MSKILWPCPFNKLKRKNSRSPKSRSWTIMDCLQKRNRRRNVNARQKIWTNAIITRLKCKSKDIAYASRKKNHVLYGRMEQRPMCPGTTRSDSTSGPRGAETLSTSPPADSAPSPSLPPLPPQLGILGGRNNSRIIVSLKNWLFFNIFKFFSYL